MMPQTHTTCRHNGDSIALTTTWTTAGTQHSTNNILAGNF